VRRDTGFPNADAQSDFLRARRSRAWAELSRRLRRESGDLELILPFEEVVEALGRVDEHDAGLRVIPIENIVGTVDRTHDFDREFRPTSSRVRARWERIATAQRRGEAMPPISVYQVGEVYFVRDGHHRVSVACALGHKDIDAYVTEVRTRVGAGREITLADLPHKGHERLFEERVPLAPEARARIELRDPWDYGGLAESVEAWGFRSMQGPGVLWDRGEVAARWFAQEYVPVVEMLGEAGLLGTGTETEGYMRVACERYRLLRTHEWSDTVVARLLKRRSSARRALRRRED
jgi:hypothetical protein